MAKKEKEPLNPQIEDNRNVGIKVDKNKALEIAKKLESIKKEYGGSNKDVESFFTEVLKQLLQPDNISLKTEYLNVNENFAGVRLDFMAKYGGMPYLRDFINIFEQKRVSLERKSRKELVMVLEQREREQIRQQNLQAQRNMFGYGN